MLFRGIVHDNFYQYFRIERLYSLLVPVYLQSWNLVWRVMKTTLPNSDLYKVYLFCKSYFIEFAVFFNKCFAISSIFRYTMTSIRGAHHPSWAANFQLPIMNNHEKFGAKNTFKIEFNKLEPLIHNGKFKNMMPSKNPVHSIVHWSADFQSFNSDLNLIIFKKTLARSCSS